MSHTETLHGVVRRVFFCNPESPFTTGVIETKEREAKFAGSCVAQVGDTITLHGHWTEHPKFGRQLQVEKGIVKIDESPEALANLLASHDAFAGIGPARAKKIAEAAQRVAESSGGDPTDLTFAMTHKPEVVAQIAGVQPALVIEAAEEWSRRSEFYGALAQLTEQGWTPAQGAKILKKLGNGAPQMVEGDPYMLIGRIARFGFKTVDVVARKMGIASTDPMRLQAGVAYCLDKIAENGSTWTSYEALITQAMEELKPDTLEGEKKIREAADELITTGIIYVDDSPVGTQVVANAKLAQKEIKVFELMLAGLGTEVAPLDSTEDYVAEFVASLNEGQRTALEGFSHRRFSVVSGGAGVGKTYTMRAICEVAESNGMVVELCAPTGKAARKLSHATERESRTIHRLLEPIFDEGEFKFTRGKDNPVEADLVVVDEVSMVDVRLMWSLLMALPPHCRLLLVGDHHQIPSVGPGAILRDLLAAQAKYPEAVHILSEVVRQAGVLARNTTALLHGVVVKEQSEAWGIMETERGHVEGSPAMVAMAVESLLTAGPTEPFNRDLDFAWDIQVLAPQRKGPFGTYALNVALQKLRQRLLGNPPPEETPEGKAPKPLVGDRVIWTKNDYQLDLLNGTQAIVMQLLKGGAMKLYTEDGREVTVPPEKRLNVEVAYAMTIHKSQGSEWPCVMLIASSSHWHMHDRNLLYTGASRAAEGLTIIGDRTAMSNFAKQQKSAARCTFGGFLIHGWRSQQSIENEVSA